MIIVIFPEVYDYYLSKIKSLVVQFKSFNNFNFLLILLLLIYFRYPVKSRESYSKSLSKAGRVLVIDNEFSCNNFLHLENVSFGLIKILHYLKFLFEGVSCGVDYRLINTSVSILKNYIYIFLLFF